MNILDQLKYPFPVDAIHWRVGSTNGDKTKGMALAYIDARDVMQRLDMVMGADWQCRYSHHGPQGTICEVGLYIDGEWRWRSDGAGETDYEATKGAMSDAFKRAAVRWGVGQYLYSLGTSWVPITSRGRSYIIEDDNRPQLPNWAIPDPTLERLHEMWPLIAEHRERISHIKECIDCGDYATAAAAWYSLSQETQRLLWLAPSKGGPFTTDERAIMKSDEFAKARNAA